MQSNTKRSVALLLALIVGVFGCMFTAHLIQTDFGNVEISQGTIEVDGGTLSYKLYVPESATRIIPLPACFCFTVIRTTARPAQPIPSNWHGAAWL